MPGVTPFFTNDLEIRVVGTGTANQIKRLTAIDGVITVHGFPFPEDIASITIDPNNWIINQDGSIFENLNGFSELNSAKLELYPNPTSGLLTVVSGVEMSARIVDKTGCVVGTYALHSGENSVDVSSLAPGAYFVLANGVVEGFVRE